MIKKVIQLSLLGLLFTSCLKTRSEVSELDQNAVYGKKNAENQIESQLNAAAPAAPVVDEKDELIRALNGRVEVLEKQISTMQEEKQNSNDQDSQKIALLQEALTKMETQLQNLENQIVENKKIAEAVLKSSDELDAEKQPSKTSDKTKKLSTFDVAESHYKNNDWKKAIISYQKYTEDVPNGKYIAEAKYKIGLCFQELGMKDEAMAFYEEVVANYAKTEAGKKSKTRLAKLKK